MPAIVSRPHTALPEHVVTLAEILKRVGDLHADVPGIERILTVMAATQVRERYFVRPAEEVLGSSDPGRDLAATVTALAPLAEQAARAALTSAGLSPREVDCLIVTSVTGYMMPGLDVTLANALGLRPQVWRIPVAQVGCAGTAWALTAARDHIAAHPSARVLVVSAEAFSSCLQPTDTSLDAMIFKALGGDGAAACVVADRDAAQGPGLRLHESWNYLVPDSTDFYGLSLDGAGLHFYSTRAAMRAVGTVLPPLLDWLADQGRHGWAVQWAAVHAGGPRILDTTAEGLGLSTDDLRHSWESLRSIGNTGSMGLQHVLGLMHDDPPAHGQSGLVVAYGPGFAAHALTATWVAG